MTLTCDMRRECPATVTHIDDKGWVYCAGHGTARRTTRPCREMTTSEIATLEAGGTIWWDPERNLPS